MSLKWKCVGLNHYNLLYKDIIVAQVYKEKPRNWRISIDGVIEIESSKLRAMSEAEELVKLEQESRLKGRLKIES